MLTTAVSIEVVKIPSQHNVLYHYIDISNEVDFSI